MFITLKKKYQRKKRDLEKSSGAGTSTESAAKAQKAFSQYEFMHWLDDFFSTRQGKSKLPLRDQFKEDENTQSLHNEENLEIPPDVTPTSIEEEREDTESDFTPNTEKASKCAWKTVQKSGNKWQSTKRARRNKLLDDTECSLTDSRKKRKTDEENADNLFCKSLAADLKEMPLYERLNAKNEIRSIVFKYQMSVLAGQSSSG